MFSSQMQKNYIINKFDLSFQMDQEAENMNIILDVDSGFRMATLPKMQIFIIELRNWYVDDKRVTLGNQLMKLKNRG